MKEYPIIFSGPMVRAILDGRKTQTRRVIKKLDGVYRLVESNYSQEEPNKAFVQDKYGDYHPMPCPYGQPGDRLWVRETFSRDSVETVYRATHTGGPLGGRWRPSIHMPRWACRLLLEVTGIRVERLQDITPHDARTEGCPDNYIEGAEQASVDALSLEWFAILWDSINGKKCPWKSDPWVWVIEFRRVVQ